MGRLYLVSTPIGNLKDITLRAIEILSEVEVIACEDTRKTGLLLKKVVSSGRRPRFLSYYESNEARRIPEIIQLLRGSQNVALVSNAGTPLISDPGYKLVQQCLQEGVEVEVIPGPSAPLAALTVSGLPPDKFLFLGFLPKKQGKRKKLIDQLTAIRDRLAVTMILFESPFRLLKTLEDLQASLGDIEIVVTRELTKIHQEIKKGRISQLRSYFQKNKPKGELTLLFSGKENERR